MCQLRKKIEVFDYTLHQLVEWDMAEYGRTKSESLANFSNVRLMKCIYGISLLSVGHPNVDNKTLFDIFDHFLAFPRGPVEIEAYSNFSLLIRFGLHYDAENNKSYLIPNSEYKNEFTVTYPRLQADKFAKNPEQAIQDLIEAEDCEWAMQQVDKSIDELKTAACFPFDDRDKLVEITHMELWKEAFYNEINKKMDTNNMTKLNRELTLFKERIGLTV